MKYFRRRKKQEEELALTNAEVEMQKENLQEALYSVNEPKEEEEKPFKLAKLEHKKVNYANAEECNEFVEDQCEEILLAGRQLVETKVEYGAVTSYLADIQRIDAIALEEKSKLCDAARNLVNLGSERTRYQNREVKISDAMYKRMEKYEDIMPAEVQKMKQNEEYASLIRDDMKHLEGEKGVLTYERTELHSKQQYIKIIAVIACTVVVALISVCYWFQAEYKMDVTIPFFMTIIMGMIGTLMIFLEFNKSNEAVRQNARKINKCISLTNKVKIKYINNRNTLDYTYQKFNVHAASELSYLWEQYIIAKDQARRYQKNTELIEYYNNVLMDELDRFGVEDTEVWMYQPLAIIENKEMVEVRHRLNNRRQKLREQIDYNNEIILKSKQEILKVIKKRPQDKSNYVAMVEKHQIDLTISDEEE